jgi:hypothetical protein
MQAMLGSILGKSVYYRARALSTPEVPRIRSPHPRLLAAAIGKARHRSEGLREKRKSVAATGDLVSMEEMLERYAERVLQETDGSSGKQQVRRGGESSSREQQYEARLGAGDAA